jgi:CheY-like chemotaxis protein
VIVPHHITVLISGTNALNNRLFKQLAELQGSTTIITDDRGEGLQAAIKNTPDLIIVDAMGCHGFELARLLKRNQCTRDIPLIVVSSHDERAIIAAGFDEYDVFVAKPIRLLDFLNLIDRFLLSPT